MVFNWTKGFRETSLSEVKPVFRKDYKLEYTEKLNFLAVFRFFGL